jgi:hypothetical protein
MKRVAFGKPFDREPCSFESTMFLDAFHSVFRAGRKKSAARAQKGANSKLIEADEF